MAKLVFLLGPPGSGKSASQKLLDPKTHFIINCDKKDLPFRNAEAVYNAKFNNYYRTSDINGIKKVLKEINEKGLRIQSIAIDTVNAIMNDREMNERRVKEFDKWTDLAGDIYDLCSYCSDMRDNLIIYMMGHSEEVETELGTKRRLKTNGKKLEKLALESKSNLVLYTEIERESDVVKYQFRTQSDGASTGKSPEGMFEHSLIPNDLKFITQTIQEYYGIKYPAAVAQKPVAAK